MTKAELQKLIQNTPSSNQESRVKYRGLSICVVMASWNEEGKVGHGVKAVSHQIIDSVLVVNNGSVDSTSKEARDAGAIVIDHPNNLGAGGGYRSGWLYGSVKKFDLIVELAGDNQDVPSEIPRAVDKLIDD